MPASGHPWAPLHLGRIPLATAHHWKVIPSWSLASDWTRWCSGPKPRCRPAASGWFHRHSGHLGGKKRWAEACQWRHCLRSWTLCFRLGCCHSLALRGCSRCRLSSSLSSSSEEPWGSCCQTLSCTGCGTKGQQVAEFSNQLHCLPWSNARTWSHHSYAW